MRATSGETATGSTHEPCTVMLFRTSKEDALLSRARGEYREMPGMRLTIPADLPVVVNSLLEAQFLAIDMNGRYRKAHSGY